MNKENITKLARARGLTMTDIANRMPNRDGGVGISKVTMSKMINGNITINKLEEIASIIGCDVSEFFSSTPEPAGYACPHCGKPIAIHLSKDDGKEVGNGK